MVCETWSLVNQAPSASQLGRPLESRLAEDFEEPSPNGEASELQKGRNLFENRWKIDGNEEIPSKIIENSLKIRSKISLDIFGFQGNNSWRL